MKTLIGILIIVAGAVIFFQGWNRKDSLAGEAATAGTKIANSLDGGMRTPRHVGYMVAGGVLVLLGIGVVANRTPPSIRS